MGARTSTIRGVFFGVALTTAIALMAMLVGCAQPQAMLAASGVPTSQEMVKAAVGDYGHLKVSIRVHHRVPSSKAPSDAEVCIPWLRPQNTAKQNTGALVLNDGLEGSLNTLTPHFRFLATVTPEAGGQVAQPAQEPAFSSEVVRLE